MYVQALLINYPLCIVRKCHLLVHWCIRLCVDNYCHSAGYVCVCCWRNIVYLIGCRSMMTRPMHFISQLWLNRSFCTGLKFEIMLYDKSVTQLGFINFFCDFVIIFRQRTAATACFYRNSSSHYNRGKKKSQK